MKIIDDCPGAAPLKRPTIIFKTCPKCGEEIELFSNDVKMKCDNCGFTVYNDTMSCVQWCEYAKECVGEETYNDVMEMLKRKKQQDEKGRSE
jgi:hypothetical protein